jgi:hypothetical protein
MANQYRNLPKQGGTPRQISEVVNNILEGKINSTGEFTTTANTTSTVVNDRRASVNSIILLVGLNSHFHNLNIYISTRANGSFTVGHTGHGNDVDIGYVIIG